MKIVLLGTTAVHHTLVAAHLYLNMITGPDLGKLGGYCDMSLDDQGRPLFMGSDRDGNQIYTLGLGRMIDVGCRAINDFRQVIGIEPDRLLAREVRLPGELDIWLASKLSRVPGGLGRPLGRMISDHVITREFPYIKKEVTRLREEIALLRDSQLRAAASGP